MIQAGLSKGLDGTLKREQIREESQNAIQQYSSKFHGEIPVSPGEE